MPDAIVDPRRARPAGLRPWQGVRGAGRGVARGEVPAGAGGEKVGLDDFLIDAHREAFRRCPGSTLGSAVLAHGGLVARLDEAAGDGKKAAAEDARTILAKAGTVTVLHPAQDVHEGVLIYGIQVDEGAPARRLHADSCAAPTSSRRRSGSGTRARAARP